MLAVCAGFQMVGTSFPGAEGEPHEGLGLLDDDDRKGRAPGPWARWWPNPTRGPWACPRYRLREPRRAHRLGEGPSRWPGSARASATATATGPRARCRGGWSGPTCTGRCWPATRRWPTSCSGWALRRRSARAARRRGGRNAFEPSGSRRRALVVSGVAGRPDPVGRPDDFILRTDGLAGANSRWDLSRTRRIGPAAHARISSASGAYAGHVVIEPAEPSDYDDLHHFETCVLRSRRGSFFDGSWWSNLPR